RCCRLRHLPAEPSRSLTTTSVRPASLRLATTFDPINPAPPVTSSIKQPSCASGARVNFRPAAPAAPSFAPLREPAQDTAQTSAKTGQTAPRQVRGRGRNDPYRPNLGPSESAVYMTHGSQQQTNRRAG